MSSLMQKQICLLTPHIEELRSILDKYKVIKEASEIAKQFDTVHYRISQKVLTIHAIAIDEIFGKMFLEQSDKQLRKMINPLK